MLGVNGGVALLLFGGLERWALASLLMAATLKSSLRRLDVLGSREDRSDEIANSLEATGQSPGDEACRPFVAVRSGPPNRKFWVRPDGRSESWPPPPPRQRVEARAGLEVRS
jgi:hypothetical protein